MPDYLSELETAKQAADKAAVLIQQFQNRKNFDVSFKGLNDLVTDADVTVEKEIKQFISKSFPDDHILAEESSEIKRVTDGRVWIIDPIDGTTNFVHNFPVYGVSVSLWEDDKPVVGVVVEVNSGDIFEAVKGNGAMCNGEPIEVSQIKKPDHALIGTGFPYNDLSLSDNYLELFRWLWSHAQAVRRPGAASYDLCCVAAGRYEGFYEYALNPWDVAAAGFIVQEAGGVVSDWKGADDWLYGQRLVAGNPSIHSFLLKAIQDHFSAEELSK